MGGCGQRGAGGRAHRWIGPWRSTGSPLLEHISHLTSPPCQKHRVKTIFSHHGNILKASHFQLVNADGQSNLFQSPNPFQRISFGHPTHHARPNSLRNPRLQPISIRDRWMSSKRFFLQPRGRAKTKKYFLLNSFQRTSARFPHLLLLRKPL